MQKNKKCGALQNDAARLLLCLRLAEQSAASGILEHFPHAFTRLGRALEVVLGANLLCNRHTLKKEIESGSMASGAVYALPRV